MTRTEPQLPAALRIGEVSVRWRRRTALVALGLIVVTAIIYLAELALGKPAYSVGEVIDVLTGGGTSFQRRTILDLRANRAIVAALAGAALGIAGAIMQSVTRNPLASPDILGITAGASLGAVTIIAMHEGASSDSPWMSAVASLIGGLIIAAIISVLAAGLDPLRMVLTGIGIAALCTAATTFTLTYVRSEVAGSAFAWLAGSLNQREPHHIWPVATVLALAIPVLVGLSRPASALSLGRTRASALGVPVATTERVLMLTSVLLASAATTAAGPIGFIAFIAPQITVRLVKTAAPPLLLSGLTGAILVLLADTVSRYLLPWEAPIGATTSALGAPVLIYFLWRATRD